MGAAKTTETQPTLEQLEKQLAGKPNMADAQARFAERQERLRRFAPPVARISRSSKEAWVSEGPRSLLQH